MPGSGTSAFSEAGDFEAALHEEGGRGLVVTGPGRFAAKLTRVRLISLSLAAGEEHLSRVVFVTAPADTIVIPFPIDDESRLIWGGNELGAGDIATLGPGGRAHARTVGPCRWGSIRLPAREAARIGRALLGTALAVPVAAKRWRGPPSLQKQLRHIHAAAIRAAAARPASLMEAEAVRGLEQQIVEPLIGCLGADAGGRDGSIRRRNQGLAARLEELLRARADASPSVAEICAALGASERVLRACCGEQLGMAPAHYMRLRRLQRVRHALLAGDGDAGGLAAVAHRCGAHDLRRLAVVYRAFFGELPSATLRRASRRGMSQSVTVPP